MDRGDSVAIYLSDEKVDSVTILKNARAMYYPVEGEANKVSNNYSTGDRMFFVFNNKGTGLYQDLRASTGLYKYLNLAPTTIDSLAASIDSTLTYKSFPEIERARPVQRRSDRILRADRERHPQRPLLSQVPELESDGQTDRLQFAPQSARSDGRSVLEEKEQKMFGNDMGYDLDSGGRDRRRLDEVRRRVLSGDNIFKVGEDVLKVYNSTYTTCDYTHPHYSFHADKMKVYIDDKIVSGPIFLYIGKMPVFYLPFMVNSLHRTRGSGFLSRISISG